MKTFALYFACFVLGFVLGNKYGNHGEPAAKPPTVIEVHLKLDKRN
jgi:hypothetical protein